MIIYKKFKWIFFFIKKNFSIFKNYIFRIPIFIFNKNNMQIGHKIKRIREIKGFSQSEVADKLHITQRAYSDVENNKTKLDLERLEKLADFFEMKPPDILTFDEKQMFNNCSSSENNYLTLNIKESFENERNSYQKQIKHMEEEIIFLRNLLKK